MNVLKSVLKNLFMKPFFANKPYRKKALMVAVLSLFAVSLISCSQNETTPDDDEPPIFVQIETPTPVPEPTPEPTPDPTPEPTAEPTPGLVSGFINPLTGEPTEEDISRNRPIAIMLSNQTAALPMNGVSHASVLYEVLVEGGMTRMMGIFQDYSEVGYIGSIRSIRHYYVHIAESYDAILMASGGSPLADHEVRDRNITYFQEGDGRFASVFTVNRTRISGRNLERLHSVVTNGSFLSRRLPEFEEKQGTRLTHRDDFEHWFTFTDDATPIGGSSANEAVVRFASGNNSTFTYNEENNVYTMRQFSRDFTDANNGERVSFTNIIVIKTPVYALDGPHGGSGRRDMPTTGSGTGYFVHGGKYIEINWSRNDKEQFVYTLNDGTKLELGVGRTYIGIIPTSMSVDFS